jgi:hypothetical protein
MANPLNLTLRRFVRDEVNTIQSPKLDAFQVQGDIQEELLQSLKNLPRNRA